MIEKAYAKINISLNVVGKRKDGYHELDMIMVPVSLYDTVYMNKADEMAQKLATVNMYKSILPHDIRDAYERGDMETLSDIAENIIPMTVDAVSDLIDAFVRMWKFESRPFGLETHQIRLGGLKQRLICVMDTINEYLDGKTDKIEELETEILYADCRKTEGADLFSGHVGWKSIVTPCIM